MAGNDHAQEAIAWMEAISWHHDEGMNGQAQATVALVHATLAVADELRLIRESQSVCAHGMTGFCMYCFQLANQ